MDDVIVDWWETYVCGELCFREAPVVAYDSACLGLCSDVPIRAVSYGIRGRGTRWIDWVCCDEAW